MFTVEERDRLHERVLEIGRSDDRVVAAAVVGSLAVGEGDRWSDVDLTFAVREDTSVADILDDWAKTLTEDLDAVCLLDLVVESTTYRVFLLPRCLQLDVSFTPASEFRPASPRFRLLYGEAGPPDMREPPSATDLLGWAVVFARDVRASIERGQVWRAERSLAALRDHALSFACRRRDLPAAYGKGHDQLPPEVLAGFTASLASSLDPVELSRALRSAVSGLQAECARATDISPRLSDYLGDLVAGM